MRVLKIGLIISFALLHGAVVTACGGGSEEGADDQAPQESVAPTPARGEQDLEARVTAEIFSGQPNPEWTLNQEDSDELSQRMGFLMPAEAGPPPEGLGYRGIVVRVDATNAVGAASIRAYGRTIYYTVEDFATGEPSTTPLQDPGGTLEPWLLSTGQEAMDSETYAAIETAIEELREGGADTGGGLDPAAGGGDGNPEPTSTDPTAIPPPTVAPTP